MKCCNRGFKKLFFLCIFEISKKRLKLFIIRSIRSFSGKTLKREKILWPQPSVHTYMVKASISISHNGTKDIDDVERSFSPHKHILDDGRYNLLDINIEMLIIVYFNKSSD